MLRLLVFIFILIASVWAGVEIMRHPGYLLLVFHPWMVQMPMWFAILATLILLVLFYFLIDSLDRLQFLGFRIKNWFRFRNEQQTFNKTQQGLSALIEGRWKKSEQLLLSGINQNVDSLMNYLGAAKAAHEQGAYERRDAYIQKAYQIAPKAEVAIGLTQSELELNQDQLEHAQATLTHLRKREPRHPRVLKLLEKVYVRLGDWQNLLGLLPNLRKSNSLTPAQFEIFEKNVYVEMLNTASQKSLSQVQEIWQSMPRAMKKNTDVVVAYVKQLSRFPACAKEMEDLIRKMLKTNYHPELVKIYASLTFANLSRQLVIVGGWLKLHGHRPEILFALGKLCVRAQLWGKAKDYFEKCISLGSYPEASLEYGKLLEHLDERDQALLKYREGLAQCAYLNSNVNTSIAVNYN